MRKLTTAVFCVLFTLTGLAQNNDYNDNFFMSFHSTAYFDFIWSPLKLENAPTGNTIIDGNGNEVPEYKEIPFQSYTNNLFSFGVEPRYNIHTIDNNTAVAVSSPISIGLGQVGQSPFISHRVGSVEGFGSIQIPLFLKLYIGSGSTYDCEKDYGVSLGAGFEYNKVGLIQLNNDVTMDVDHTVNDGKTITIGSGVTLTILTGKLLTINGILQNDGGIDGQVKIQNNSNATMALGKIGVLEVEMPGNTLTVSSNTKIDTKLKLTDGVINTNNNTFILYSAQFTTVFYGAQKTKTTQSHAYIHYNRNIIHYKQ